MSQLKELVAAILVVIVVAMAFAATNANLWWGQIPKRFALRHLLIAATAIAVFLGMCVAFAPR